MVYRQIVAAFATVIINVSLLTAAQVAPIGASLMNLDLGDKISTYHRIPIDSLVTLAVTGPGRLDLVVRLVFVDGKDTTDSYELKVTDEKTVTQTFQTNTTVAKAKWQSNGARAGTSRKFTLQVPAGDHRYTLKMSGAKARAAGIRYLFYGKRSTHKDDSDVYPIAMSGSTTVEFKEKLLDFFVADSLKPVVAEVNGPTTLRVITRLAYSGRMKGPQKYGISISLDGSLLRTDALTTEKSVNTKFSNHNDWSVGESRTIYVDIPKGKHRISFSLRATQAPAVTMRFTIPREDVNNATE